ncbi:hypothetical protein [Rhodoferax ferrireducens]|uniref:hypothetical protein n=1 Tax=Rhodoferax ferrireducens TaxID=192843 RepID=UPI003BB5C28C
MTIDVLKLVEGSPVLSSGGWVPLAEAVGLSGIGMDHFLRAAAGGVLRLFCRLSQVRGYDVALDELEPNDAMAGRSGGVVIPQPNSMPVSALERTRTDMLPLSDVKGVAAAVLANGLQSVEIVAFDLPGHPGMLFAPDTVMTVPVQRLEVLVADVETQRRRLAHGVSSDAIEHAKAARKAMVEAKPAAHGKWASKRFSEAVDAYCSDKEGLAKTLASKFEQRQRKAGIMLFAEFMGDLPLSEIDSDTIRAFRDGPLKTLPGKVNHLPKEIKRATMKETIEALKADGRAWPVMTRDMQRERMLWLFRLFAWLHTKKHLADDLASAVRDELGLTRAEAIEVERKSEADDEEEGRRSFTDDELARIFGQTHFKTGNGVHVTKGNQAWRPFEYWMPLLALYAGCRISEAAQLHLTDVALIDDVWCIDINRKTADKSLKTPASARVVPIHARLIELGFVDYCRRLREKGFRRVFAELSYTNTPARYAKEAIRRFSAMLEGLGMPRDNTRVFHNFRRNANNGLARVPIAELISADEMLRVYIRYTVIGHKLPADVNREHYTETSKAEMTALVNGLTYVVPEIAPFDIEHGLYRVGLALKTKHGFRRDREDMGPLNDELPTVHL